MKKSKKMLMAFILLIMLILSIWFMVLDFSRFFNQDYSYDIFPSAVLKRICVILAASIAWSVGRDGLDPRDSRLMKAAFLFACIGETAFAVNERIIGVWSFGICQLLLIIRNLRGFGCGLYNAGKIQKRLLLITGISILLVIGVFVFVFAVFDKSMSIHTAVLIYGILLSISLWAGLAAHILHLLPPANSVMAALGMICFFCCDVLVGLDAALEAGLPWLLANSFIWVFYIPALTLLALSCYKHAGNRITY
jgi:hypothetical protein